MHLASGSMIAIEELDQNLSLGAQSISQKVAEGLYFAFSLTATVKWVEFQSDTLTPGAFLYSLSFEGYLNTRTVLKKAVGGRFFLNRALTVPEFPW
eukprot:CAMPEP_0170180348 /NCGR_PEP_ID=MMETSP0040_2-20121228/21675_1 /TAXON_ID=641309 /ORGANISM="Lotharella oceanica, Strain CCMP622" /LENGTH=95 /DNA_ID=CAMNT_0010424945 /DNA_START=85 /DNA_END=373 /DNA_ORIENTATION=+